MEFEEIYMIYFKDVYLYIKRLSGNEHIAEEITSETFFKAMQAIERFRGDCDLRSWLCQIAKNCYFTYQKKYGRLESIEEVVVPDLSDGAKSVEEMAVQRETAGQVQKVLHGMSEPYKEVFMWRVFAELSFREIGQIFQKSENWACVTYHRARKIIRERLEDCGYE